MSYQSNEVGTQLTPEEQVSISELANLGTPGQVLTVNPAGTGLDYETPTAVDDKVKLSASDPTAGYLDDKIVAGGYLNAYLKLDQTTPQTFTNLGGGTGLMKVTAGVLGLDTNISGTNTGDQTGDGVTITGTGTALDPFVAVVGSSQTPWTSDIDAAGYNLSNANNITAQNKTDGTDATPLNLNSGSATGTGSASNVNITGADKTDDPGTGNTAYAGSVAITAGNATPVTPDGTVIAGDVILSAGQQYKSGMLGGNVILKGGYSDAGADGMVQIQDPSTFNVAMFDTSTLTANHIQVIPDKDGTFAMTSDLFSISKSITYNVDGTLNVITDAKGTKTMTYNVDGTLASITGTGVYQSKTFTYAGGVLTAITV